MRRRKLKKSSSTRHGGDHDKITAMINLLTNEFTSSPQANHRKGGLIRLAAATVETISKP
ncbi:hypothetical protein Scep_024352 [Stephania cephalantha]|uniref:Uncharacterized protein n=1 Tax=Stephania cephalantha TaxID=152367 RepID=A0AAP0F1U6_9MAGN